MQCNTTHAAQQHSTCLQFCQLLLQLPRNDLGVSRSKSMLLSVKPHESGNYTCCVSYTVGAVTVPAS